MLAQGRKTPRAVRHEDTERRILDAALALVAEGGFDGLSMSKLADGVGFTPGALYRYIGSKDALLAKIIERALADVRAFLDASVERLPAGVGPLPVAAALSFAYRAFARERPHQFGLLAICLAEPRLLLQDPAEAQGVMRGIVAALAPVSRALEEAVSRGELSPGDCMSRTVCLFGMLQGLSQLDKQVRNARAPLDLDGLVAAGVSSLLLGWGASQRHVDEAFRIAGAGPRAAEV